MKKRIFLIVASIAILGTILSVSVYAGFKALSAEENSEDKIMAYPDAYIREDAKKEKTIIGINGKPEKVTYKHSRKRNENDATDIYVDENDSEYRFDESGNLVGIYNNESQNAIIASDNDECISAEEAIEIATKDAEKNYGEIFEKFQYARYNIQSYGPIYVFFYIYHGADNFVLGESLTYSIDENGGVSFSTLANVEDFKEFDETLLDGLTRSDVEESMRIQLSEKYGDELLNYEFGEIQLTRIEERYCLRSAVTLHFNDYLKKEALYFELG